jgi:hypothetical protein
LLFAGYLNFFKKDKDVPVEIIKTTAANPSRSTVLVSDPEHYFKTNAKSEVTQPPVAKKITAAQCFKLPS